jgi:NAD(P)-dependent dehydrogenase (short-subunit alcohol dehydrogenase family)
MTDRVKDHHVRDAFAGRSVLVTGATTGIGRGLCEELGRLGARVVVTGRDPSRAEQVAESIRRSGGRAEAMQLDVTRDEEFARVIDHVVAEHGGLDYLFNNAGILVAGDARSLPADAWDRLMAVNLRGAVTGSRLAYEVMCNQGSGHIVNVSSSAGLIPAPILTPYATMKHGIVGLSMCLRMEGRRHGVRVSVVCPGYVKSEMLDKGRYSGVGRPGVEKLLHFKPWETQRAVDVILRGVARNRAVIAFPFYVRFFWWLYRTLPGLYFYSTRFTIDRD